MNKNDLISERENIEQRRADLDAKLKDTNFTRSLPSVQDGLLRRELGILEQYSQILNERIANFFDPQPGVKEGIAVQEDQKLVDQQQQRQNQPLRPLREAPAVAQKQAQDAPKAQEKAPIAERKAPPKKMAVRKPAPKLLPKVTHKVASKKKK